MEHLPGFKPAPESLAGEHQRTAHRDSMFLQARGVRADMVDAVLRVRNLSAGGMMAESDQPFTKGEALTIELRGVGMIGARIAWVKLPRVGIAFNVPIDPKMARKAPLRSPGSNLLVVPAARSIKRPALR